MGSLTFDELRLRLVTVSNDLARFHGGRLPPQRTDPSWFWSTTRDALDGLMQGGLLTSSPLPSKKDTLPQYSEHRFTLTAAGRELLALESVSAQRERLAVSLYRAYAQFQRYVQRLAERPLFEPEFTETELDALGVSQGNYRYLAEEIVQRLAHSPADGTHDPAVVARRIRDYVERRAQRNRDDEDRRTSARPSPSLKRKDLLDAVTDGTAGYVTQAAGINADATSLSNLHEWGRQFFLTGSSRYVADMPRGLLHWSAAEVIERDGTVTFVRRTLATAGDEVVQAIGVAYRKHLREATRLVEYYRLRATAAYIAGVSNDLVDRVVGAMVTGRLPNPYGLVPSAGAHWSPPPSERPLRIGDRRYTLVSCTHDF
jgi:hypothetical protein